MESNFVVSKKIKDIKEWVASCWLLVAYVRHTKMNFGVCFRSGCNHLAPEMKGVKKHPLTGILNPYRSVQTTNPPPKQATKTRISELWWSIQTSYVVKKPCFSGSHSIDTDSEECSICRRRAKMWAPQNSDLSIVIFSRKRSKWNFSRGTCTFLVFIAHHYKLSTN